jgi:hypothetical protein
MLAALSWTSGGCARASEDTPATAEAAEGLAVVSLVPGADRSPVARPAVELTRGVAQVQLRLAGDFPELDHLMAEIAPTADPDSVGRWRVDPAPAGADRAGGLVSVPVYALAPGDYTLTVWEGDARVVGRYPFQVRRR